MKLLKSLAFLFAAAIFFIGCQKELSFENGTARGTLKEDAATNECLPATVNGNFVRDTVLKTTNYIDLQVNITTTGTYDIRTDTLNGYSFRGLGTVAVAGLNTVRLTGAGTPLVAGVDVFTVTFDTTSCEVNVVVTDVPVAPAMFTYSATGGNCTGAVLGGTYQAGMATTSSNQATLSVDVTGLGAYTITTNSANGVTFSGSGTFTTTGAQTVNLIASGTPTAAGSFNYTPTGTGGCAFSVTYTAAAPPATYTISCAAASVAGSYTAGTPTTSSNTVTLQATATSAGSWSVTTNTVNGFSFAGSGMFAAAGTFPITLTATGTPTAAGMNAYTATASTGGGSSCPFNVTATAAAGPATYTLNCGTPTISGDFIRNNPLTASNTVTISANVTVAGTYTITTNTVSGAFFSATGTFATTGVQNVVLRGNGTSLKEGNVTYTVTGGTCTFTVLYDFISASVNGVADSFDIQAGAFYDDVSIPGYNFLVVGGFASPDPNDEEGINVAIGIQGTGTPTPGTYTVNQFNGMTGPLVLGDYISPTGTEYIALSNGSTQTPPFTITITTISSTRVTGTFFGPVKDNDGAGPGVRQITSGSFNVRIQ